MITLSTIHRLDCFVLELKARNMSECAGSATLEAVDEVDLQHDGDGKQPTPTQCDPTENRHRATRTTCTGTSTDRQHNPTDTTSTILCPQTTTVPMERFGKTSRRLQNGFLANQAPAGFFYTNYAFEKEDPVAGPSTGTVPDVEQTAMPLVVSLDSLETLVKFQKQELLQLKEEFELYREQWQSRLKETKRQQREERRRFLRILQGSSAHRNVEDTTSENVSEIHVIPLQNDLSGCGDSSHCGDTPGGAVNIYEV